ncbi:MAG TPA: hypothetical protein VF020_11505 [Chthoniobacterales bacterium]
MPDVGLTSSAEPLSDRQKVVIKYTIEIDGLPVYSETYDAAKLGTEVDSDEDTVRSIWFRRVLCVIKCRRRPGFSACLTRCLLDGKARDKGA